MVAVEAAERVQSEEMVQQAQMVDQAVLEQQTILQVQQYIMLAAAAVLMILGHQKMKVALAVAGMVQELV